MVLPVADPPATTIGDTDELFPVHHHLPVRVSMTSTETLATETLFVSIVVAAVSSKRVPPP